MLGSKGSSCSAASMSRADPSLSPRGRTAGQATVHVHRACSGSRLWTDWASAGEQDATCIVDVALYKLRAAREAGECTTLGEPLVLQRAARLSCFLRPVDQPAAGEVSHFWFSDRGNSCFDRCHHVCKERLKGLQVRERGVHTHAHAR